MDKATKKRVVELQKTIRDAQVVIDWATRHLERYPSSIIFREILEQKTSVISRANAFIEAVTNKEVGA